MTDHPHFNLTTGRTRTDCVKPGGFGPDTKSIPKPERRSHAEQLLSDLARAEQRAHSRRTSHPNHEGLQFIPMRFEQSEEIKIELERLENERRGIKIITAKPAGETTKFVVAVPDSQVAKFAAKFRAYRDDLTESGNPKNEALSAGIKTISDAELIDYWTEPSSTPPDPSSACWWEVWLEVSDGVEANEIEAWYRETAATQSLIVSPQKIQFPERLVILTYASWHQWQTFPGLLKYLAELRRSNIVTSEFTDLPPAGQAEYINALVSRCSFATGESPRVCILDTGVNRGHPLLSNSLSQSDAHCWRPEWKTGDHHGHGTLMAGVCLYGSLGEVLYDDAALELEHRLESVKILPPTGSNDPPDYGPITIGSMALAELQTPDCNRVFCMAVTAECDDEWRPTLWSGAIDQACAGVEDGTPRLMVVSAGNLRERIGENYPNENLVSSVEDPGQAWNVLTVGGYTNLAWIRENGLEGYAPIAEPGGLSPTSRTSLCWGDDNWPYKPDVVFEAGNFAKNSHGTVADAEDLAILTTQASPTSSAPLAAFRDTSAATALAARMAAILQSEYPHYWPETIRGLIVHSADWTPKMLSEFPHQSRRQRLRVFGMGVPNLETARRSARGFATMVVQDKLQPFDEGDRFKDIHFHDLPLPRDVLLDLGDLEVQMRVTLSYFIQPNPPRRGYIARHSYASHGLRFSVRRPQESIRRMVDRLTKAEWDRDESGKRIKPSDGTVSDDRTWSLGPEMVAVKGSIHSDRWTGTAAQLANSDRIAVFPTTGWWRYRSNPAIVTQKARYSLIVSICTNKSDVDLYSMIQTEIANRTKVAPTAVATEIESE